MQELFARYRNVSVLGAVLFLQFILLAYQVRTNSEAHLLRVWVVGLVAPIESALDGASDFVSGFWSHYVWLVDARRENDRLQSELGGLKIENRRLERMLSRFERAEVTREYQRGLASQTVPSEVIGVGSNPSAKEIFLDKGRRDGIEKGMAVITADGIVGKVQAAYAGSSLVVLIHDPGSAVGVILARSRARRVMKGEGKLICRVEYLGPEIDVRVGERVYTSGDDRTFPKGLPVGEVVRVSAGGEFQQVFVRPFAPLERLDEVLIVKQGVHDELPEAPAEPGPPRLLLPPPRPEPGGEREPGAPAAGPGERSPLTDADRLHRRYREIGAAQGHAFGRGTAETPPPDFNRGFFTFSQGAGSAPRPGVEAAAGGGGPEGADIAERDRPKPAAAVSRR